MIEWFLYRSGLRSAGRDLGVDGVVADAVPRTIAAGGHLGAD